MLGYRNFRAAASKRAQGAVMSLGQLLKHALTEIKPKQTLNLSRMLTQCLTEDLNSWPFSVFQYYCLLGICRISSACTVIMQLVGNLRTK